MLTNTMRYFLITIALVPLLGSVFCKIDYYWREYTGVVPPDAVIVGSDISGNDLYVGQAYLRGTGWQVVPIYKNVKEVTALLAGPRKIDKYIKILCGPLNNFRWVLTDKKNFENDLKGKHVVVGGHEDGHGDVYVGRIVHEGETKIGKINTFAGYKYSLLFNNRGQEKNIDLPYQVLIYDESSGIDAKV